MFHLIAIVVFLQALYVYEGRMIYKYNDVNIADFRCTNKSPVQYSPDTYQSTTNVVDDRRKMKKINTEFPLIHVFCGQINSRKQATGFHSVAAQNKTSPSARRNTTIKRNNRQYYEVEVYNANSSKWIYADQEKTFFPDDFTVKGISRCISQWAAECYFREKISGNIKCLQLYNIPYPKTQSRKFGIRLFYAASNPSNPTLMIHTAYPTGDIKNPPDNCGGCEFKKTITKCCLMQ